jgi:ribosomal protein S21
MANVTRVRVELKRYNPNASREEKERAFKGMFSAFKKQCNEAGILAQWKQKQFYESKGEKRRRKAKETAANVKKEELKQKLRQHFG